MEKESSKITSVEAYLASQTKETQVILEKLRAIIKKAAPEAQEKISYSMPYYHFHGRLAYFAAFTNHYSLYVMKHVVIAFKDKLKDYERGAATIQFRYDQPLPEKLVSEIIKFAVKANLEKAFLKDLTKGKK